MRCWSQRKSQEEEDEPIELGDFEGTPFTYFNLSSRDSTQVMNAEDGDDDDDDDDDDDYDVILMEEAGKKQAATHISVSPDTVLASTGEDRQKRLATRKKDIDNLTLPKAITALSP